MKTRSKLNGRELLKYIGPGFLVTAGFIDPGNWAANMAAGSGFGYPLLWVVTLSTIMLIILQHNAAHLGIVTGLCISEAASKYYKRWVSRILLATAVAASVSTALAELMGAAIGLNMLFKLPLNIGAIMSASFVALMLLTNSYSRLERWVIGFVSLVGISFIYELTLCDIQWGQVAAGTVIPSVPSGSLPIIMSVLGAVVMPHNLFLHSEFIQSRKWNEEGGGVIKERLKYEFLDTFAAMWMGWAINSAMIVLAAALFFSRGIGVTELSQAQEMLRPLLGGSAATVFAIALVCAGVGSSVTAAMAGGSIYAGIFGKAFNISERHSRVGVLITLGGAIVAMSFLTNPFSGLIWSQIILGMQLPITVFTLMFLTSSRRVMGDHVNSVTENLLNWGAASVVVALNAAFFVQMFRG